MANNNFLLTIVASQVEGVSTLTVKYKLVQDSFAEQVAVYLQAAWRRHAARKLAT